MLSNVPRPLMTETEIATLWTDAQCRCVLSWDGYRYRVRLMRGAAVMIEEADVDEHVVYDIAVRWRVQRLVRSAGA